MKRFLKRPQAVVALSGFASTAAIVALLIDAHAVLSWPRHVGSLLVAVITLAVSLALGVGVLRGRESESIAAFAPDSFDLSCLSDRERELVLEFLGGASMKEIAVVYGISYSTVRNTFSAVYRKLNVSGSSELFALGSRYRVQ